MEKYFHFIMPCFQLVCQCAKFGAYVPGPARAEKLIHCLDATAPSPADGAPLQIWDRTGGADHKAGRPALTRSASLD
jgi:hypothetical protein